MTTQPAGAPTGGHVPFGLLLAEVTVVQILATLAVLTLATIAPAAARSLGIGAEAVGYQISLIYAAAATMSGVAGPAVRRWGAGTVGMAAMVCGLAGSLGLALGSLWTVVLASLAFGIGYGLVNPASSHLLNRFTPPARRNLVFSAKQTGVPLGGMVAGMLLPVVSDAFGWRAAALAVALLFVLTLAVFGPHRRRWDDDRVPGLPLRGTLFDGLRLMWGVPALRGVAVMAFCFAGLQLCLMTFTVTMLVHDLHWTLVQAGGAIAMVQASGAVARLGWGVLADRIGGGAPVLAGLGVLAAVCAVATAWLGPGWPPALVIALLSVFGAASIGWNGVFLAEVARVAPPGAVSAATGGVMMVTFAGVVVGPALFALAFDQIGGYGATFAALAVFPLIGGLAILRTLRTKPV